MCLTLTYLRQCCGSERRWPFEGARAANIRVDPLLRSAPKLSNIDLKVVDRIKKRHGTLIEDALIAAINFTPDWTRNEVPHSGAPTDGYLKLTASP